LPKKAEERKIYLDSDFRFEQSETDYGKIDIHDAALKASLPTEIDLHIQKLVKKYEHMSNADILKIQLSAFEDYLSKALMFRLPKVYAIHGIGKGKLKREIENLLNEYPDIKSFNNNYHPAYGYGATEIIID
jgi:hypothetical protein